MNLGEVVELGHHRLVCGDAFNPEHRALLLQGEKPDMLYCDPPYGMGVETTRKKAASERSWRATNAVVATRHDFAPVHGDDGPFNPVPIIESFSRCREQFWFGADYYRACLPEGGSWIAWDKRTPSLDAVFGSAFELCWSRTSHRREVARVKWCGVYGMEQEPIGGRVHPTQKPVRLAEWFLSRYSKENGVILDLFAGSGSTLLACERVNRRALVMEIDPHYCSVIEQRYHALAKQPRLLESA